MAILTNSGRVAMAISVKAQQMGLEGGAVVRDQGIARYQQIQSENPYL